MKINMQSRLLLTFLVFIIFFLGSEVPGVYIFESFFFPASKSILKLVLILVVGPSFPPLALSISMSMLSVLLSPTANAPIACVLPHTSPAMSIAPATKLEIFTKNA